MNRILSIAFRTILHPQFIHLFLMRASKLVNLLLLITCEIRNALADVASEGLLREGPGKNHEGNCSE